LIGKNLPCTGSDKVTCPRTETNTLQPIHRIPSRPPSLFLWGRTCASAGGQKTLQCILQLSKCPPADAHVRGAMETKMAASWEYDEYNIPLLHGLLPFEGR
jgi:hypothetical protein